MRVLLSLSFVLVLGTCIAQGDEKLSADVSVGLIAPTGKELSASYAVGLGIGVEGIYRPGKYFIGLEFSGDLFVNYPPSAGDLSDNLILFGPSLKAGYVLTKGNFSFEPFVSIGYEWGINSIAPRGRSSGQSVDLMNLKGLSIGPGFMIQVSDRALVGVCYKFYSPHATLTQNALSGVNSTPTQLYGPLITIPEQKLTMDRFSVRFHWTL